jgi:hypothetical protein
MTWNGKKIDDVKEIHISKYAYNMEDGDELSVRVTQMTEDDDTRIMTYMMNKASEIDEVEEDKNTLQSNINSYLQSRKSR